MDNKKNMPTVFVIFGATGDLMRKKIAPALFHLFKKGKLPKLLQIIGFSRRAMTSAEFKKNIQEILQAHKDTSPTPEELQNFLRHVVYHSGDFQNAADYERLAADLGRIDGEWKVCSNKLFYLAVPPNYYENILNNLHDSGLTIPCSPQEGWTRVIVEKPFGRDLEAARRLDLLLGKLFKEEQVYRIDHYVGKEMLQNILSFRFSNTLLEESWNNKFVEKIEVRVYEEGGVGSRGAFYDGLGALRDVGQNHLLQMATFVTMDNPGAITPEHLRLKKTALLSAFEKLSSARIKSNTFRGQYQGYRNEKDVAHDSKTETYFKIKCEIKSPRWQGVPIILESGKNLPSSVKEIIVTFKHPSPCFCPPGAPHLQNKVVFKIEPHMEIDINFLSKKPGLAMMVEERNFNFSYKSAPGAREVAQDYEKLLVDCIEGNQMLFISTAEIAAEWEFVGPIIAAWEKNMVPLEEYAPGTDDSIKKADARLDAKATVTKSIKREIGVVGLGKMGTGIAKHLLDTNWKVVGYNRTASVASALKAERFDPVKNIPELVEKLAHPRVLWVMVPAGTPTEEVIFDKSSGLINYLEKGDTVIDAGNSFYQDAARRGATFKEKEINFLDVGVSGGPAGARYGACLMIGGDRPTYEELLPLWVDLSVPEGYQFFEGLGAGHFVKMVHNGIEYGMMQALAEGFAILRASDYKLNLKNVAHIYNHGSVVESRLVGWLESALELYGDDLKGISGSVAHTGEGAWTVEAAKLLKIKTKVIEGALEFRLQSAKNPDYTGKILSALRNMFGGHTIK